MLMTDSPIAPSFSIVGSQAFLSSQQSVNSDVHTLPKNFIISLSYKPLNNTILSLFSLMSYSSSQLDGTTQANDTATFQSELMLSHAMTLVHLDSYYDLMRNFSSTAPLRYSLNLIVMDGKVGMCLNGDYHPPMDTVRLWKDIKTTDSLELNFSPYLRSVSELVDRHFYTKIIMHKLYIFYAGNNLQYEDSATSRESTFISILLFISLPYLRGNVFLAEGTFVDYCDIPMQIAVPQPPQDREPLNPGDSDASQPLRPYNPANYYPYYDPYEVKCGIYLL